MAKRKDLRKKSSLAIIYTFYPYIDTSGIVFAKRINQEIKEDITVITNKYVSNARLDKSLEVLVKPYLNKTIEIQSTYTYREWKHFESFIEGAFNAYLEELENGKKFDTIYSRSMSVITHLVAYKIKMHDPSIKWVAEFSDPLLKELNGEDKVTDIPVSWLLNNNISEQIANFNDNTNLFLLSEILVYFFADKIIFTNDLQKKVMIDYISEYCFNQLFLDSLIQRINKNSIIMGQTTLPPEYYELSSLKLDLNENYINMGYFGNFNPQRDFGEFFKAWRILPKSDKEKIRLYIFTNISKDKVYKDIPNDFLDFIFVENSLNYIDYLGVLKQFDYLISIDTKVTNVFGCNPFLPSKISDYLGSEAKILAFVEKYSPVDAIDNSKINKQYFGQVDLKSIF